jgi:hypothetical protein
MRKIANLLIAASALFLAACGEIGPADIQHPDASPSVVSQAASEPKADPVLQPPTAIDDLAGWPIAASRSGP